MIDDHIDDMNSQHDQQPSERFRLCWSCHDIFSVADDIFSMVKHRKEKMFELYSKRSINPGNKRNNKHKNHENHDKENFDSVRSLAPRRGVLKDCTNQLPPPTTNPHPYSSHLLKSHNVSKTESKSTSRNGNNIDLSENLDVNDISGDNHKHEEDDEQMFKKHAFWYHLSPGEKDRLRRKLYIPPSSDDQNGFYFVGNQRIVRRTK